MPPTVITGLSRAGFAETREADAELVTKDGIRAAINTTTHAVRLIFGNIELDMARWYQRGFVMPVLMNGWGSGWGFSKRLERETPFFGTPDCCILFRSSIFLEH
jgi:hypothetical protein